MRPGLLLPLLAPLAALILCAPMAAAQEVERALADRIVAVVDEDPILLSDLERAIGLGLTTQEKDEEAIDFQRRTLDVLVDEKLRFHEIDRYGFQELPLMEVDRLYREIASRFASRKAFEERMAELALTPTALRERLARRLLVEVFVEERLGPRVFVSRQSIQEYYDEVLQPEMRRRGQPVPEVGEVREQIRSVLRERRLDEELIRWTDDLRANANVLDFLEDTLETLPPVVER
jgi:hypothetical protein